MATGAHQAAWQSRITGHGNEDPTQLLASPTNSRIHGAHQQKVMEETLDDIGWIDEILVSQRSGHVINGHMRVQLAISRGEPTVPVTYVDLTPEQEAKALVLFDHIGAMAGIDPEILNQALDGLDVRGPATQSALDGLRALAANLPQHEGLFPPNGLRPTAPPAPFAGGAVDAPASPYTWDDGADGGELPESSVRMVQLFFDTTTHPHFMALEQKLRGHFQTDNMTDSVLATMRWAAQELGLGG